LGKRIFIAGSVGPTGKILEPYGDLKVSEVYKNYKEQAVVLEKAGVDLIILETFYETFDKNLKTIYGVDPERAVTVLENKGADGIGANCGTGPEVLCKVLKIMKKVSKTYLMVEPNAGMPELVKDKVVYPASPKIMADYTEKFIKLGLNLIGGCCGTTPLHIKAMSDKIKN
jgi:5-methyltetrahydrofolate--homocysteine methyltransferase